MATESAVAIQTLFTAIDKLNGIEHYVPAEVPDTPLSDWKVFAIPPKILAKVVNVRPEDIGKQKLLTSTEVFVVAAANYEALVAHNHPHAAEVAVLRSLIASRGFAVTPKAPAGSWVNGDLVFAAFTKRAEIRVVAAPAEIGIDEKGDLAKVGAPLRALVEAFEAADNEDFVKMATLLPIFASIEFQKTNHHYIDDEFYRESYKRHFKSAQLQSLTEKWNKASIIYDATHWLGPMNMEQYKNNLVSDKKGYVPRGISIKSKPAPAGTALCRTQLAVWKAIAVYPGGSELVNFYSAQLEAMNALAKDIENDRLSYHVFAPLFNKVSLLEDPKTVDRMTACSQLAAVAQAFIETVAKGTDLARARALKKHADQNIALFKIATAVFKGTLRKVEREATVSALVRAVEVARPAAERTAGVATVAALEGLE
jgi:hypothetical protein